MKLRRVLTAPYKNGDIVKYRNRDGDIRCGTIAARRKASNGTVLYSIRVSRGMFVYRSEDAIIGKTDKEALYRCIRERQRERAEKDYRR